MADRLKSSSGNMQSQIGLKLHDINAIVSSCDSMLKIAAHTRDQAKILQRQITELSRSNPGRTIVRRQSSAKPPTGDAHPIRVAVAPKQMIDSETTSNSSFVSGPDAVKPHKPAPAQRAVTHHQHAAADRSHLGNGASRPQSVAIGPQPPPPQRLKNISTMVAPKPQSGRPSNYHNQNASAALRRAQQQKHDHQMLANRKAHHTFLVRRQQPPKSSSGAAGPPQQQPTALPKVESAPQPQLQQLSALAAPLAVPIGLNGQRVTSSRTPADNVAFM